MLKLFTLIFTSLSFACFAKSDQGCGLGDLALKKKSMISATGRYTLNSMFSSQWFGTTSGTSGCARHSIVKKEMKPVHYTEVNHSDLTLELAQGKGQFVDGLALVLGCKGAAVKHAGPIFQNNYEAIFKKENQSPRETLENVKDVIQKNHVLKESCHTQV